MPAPIQITVNGIADTSNFDDFGDVDLSIPGVKDMCSDATYTPPDKGEFLQYTFQRFQCLTQMKRFGNHSSPQQLHSESHESNGLPSDKDSDLSVLKTPN